MSGWEVGEYNEFLGYECMTGGIRVGPVVLDGADYGQKRCQNISDEALARMKADAAVIAAAHDAIAVCRLLVEYDDLPNEAGGVVLMTAYSDALKAARAVIAKEGIS